MYIVAGGVVPLGGKPCIVIIVPALTLDGAVIVQLLPAVVLVVQDEPICEPNVKFKVPFAAVAEYSDQVTLFPKYEYTVKLGLQAVGAIAAF